MRVRHVGSIDAQVVGQLVVGPHLRLETLPQAAQPDDLATCQGGGDCLIEPVPSMSNMAQA